MNVTKGPGDLPGDNSNPNSPGYSEPAFGLDDAAASVAAKMIGDGDVPELVETVADAAGALAWVAKNIVVDDLHRRAFARLLEQAESLRRRVDDECEALNAQGGDL